ncbi:HDOD domain-containing protein [Candidatus Colwellia aromaticivorans]|uniref:HDOD domain-containing protein n=1 Tax=Candidatus Colwellia aromaticivorans TaxID=2267621 RepID=UPI000DF1B54B|nr:HDOD domain-containing protein [Candidatus Colwellia aromaticivorans]
MLKKTPNTAEQWIELIANTELPAITSTAKMLDKFSNDDKSSLPKLSKAILHDQALSSCLLKVANNTQHMGVNKVTTVSRATVILGIQTVKNVCLTAKLVDSLLASKSLDFLVYERLMQLMANSFFAAMLAKMMVPNYSDETQEEVYLAALLYGIGETAFWSSGGKIADQLACAAGIDSSGFKEYCEQEIGTSFNSLSRGLARTWNLSDLLLKALDQPESRTDEVKIVFFADKLSTSIAQPGENEEDFTKLLDNIAKIMKITVSQLKVRITHTREQAAQLLSSYGADVLIDLIKVLPKASDFNQNSGLASINQMSKEKKLLSAFMKLTKLMKSSRDINKFLQTILIDIINVFEFERCSFLMLSDDKTQVKSRFVFNSQAENDPTKIAINIRQSDNAIGRVLDSKMPALINDYSHRQWRDIITKELVEFIQEGSLAIIPVKIGDRAVGVVCAQYFSNRQARDIKSSEKSTISTDDFQQLCSLIDHLNLCLTMITLR